MIRKEGRTTPQVAQTAPRKPATRFPINVAALMAIGPGVDSATLNHGDHRIAAPERKQPDLGERPKKIQGLSAFFCHVQQTSSFLFSPACRGGHLLLSIASSPALHQIKYRPDACIRFFEGIYWQKGAGMAGCRFGQVWERNRRYHTWPFALP